MNDNQFLFVTCVNDQQLYDRCVKSIRDLHIPKGFQVDLLPLYDVSSMASGYNRAIDHQAKYKVYLHQDTHILNRNLLFDLLRLFQRHPKLGLIGLVGAKGMNSTGIWWKFEKHYGKFYTLGGKGVIFSFRDTSRPFEKVDTVDGFFMATQYDIRWREDLFTHFHYYDLSQSLEFSNKGYDVGVAYQSTVWCSHISGAQGIEFDKNFIEANEIFKANYLVESS